MIGLFLYPWFLAAHATYIPGTWYLVCRVAPFICLLLGLLSWGAPCRPNPKADSNNDPFYDRGSTFISAILFLKEDGVPWPPPSRRNVNINFEKHVLWTRAMWDYSPRRNLIFFLLKSVFGWGVWSSLSGEPREIEGEPLSKNASIM